MMFGYSNDPHTKITGGYLNDDEALQELEL